MSTANSRMKRVAAFSRRIMDYLHRHPDASDTLEGIAAWWLDQQHIEQLVEEVTEALELLVKKGFLSVHKKNSGTTTYKIKKK